MTLVDLSDRNVGRKGQPGSVSLVSSAVKCNIMQRLHKSLHLTSQSCFRMFLQGSPYPGLLTLQRQAELLEAWGFTSCLSPLQRIMFLLLTAAPARPCCLAGWAASASKTPDTTAGVAKWAEAGRGGLGDSPQGRRGLQWPKECGPRVGCDSQRASPSALGAKGERCKAWTCDPLVQSFGWCWNSEEKKHKQELQEGAWEWQCSSFKQYFC